MHVLYDALSSQFSGCVPPSVPHPQCRTLHATSPMCPLPYPIPSALRIPCAGSKLAQVFESAQRCLTLEGARTPVTVATQLQMCAWYMQAPHAHGGMRHTGGMIISTCGMPSGLRRMVDAECWHHQGTCLGGGRAASLGTPACPAPEPWRRPPRETASMPAPPGAAGVLEGCWGGLLGLGAGVDRMQVFVCQHGVACGSLCCGSSVLPCEDGFRGATG